MRSDKNLAVGDAFSISTRYELNECFGYYAYNEYRGQECKESNRASDDMPLILNCTGFFTSKHPFSTDKPRGRLDYYLMYINSGALTVFNRDTPIEVGAGSLIIFRANERYRYASRCGDTLSYFWAHFTGSEVEERLSEYSLECFPAIHSTEAQNHIPHRFRTIFDAFPKQDALRERELSALLERLLITASRSIIKGGERNSTLTNALRHIGANYSSDIRISDLAAIEHLSVSRFNFLFKEQIGMPPTKYILALRMSSAKELLASTDLPVKQIGIMCGYDDPHFFSKAFKSFCSVSPAEYRKGFGE